MTLHFLLAFKKDCQLDSDLSSALRYHDQPINQQQPDELTELFSL